MAEMRREMFLPPLEMELVPGARAYFAVRHAEQYAAVFAPLLALEPLQHALVAEGLQVVAHAVEDVVHEGVAPVQRAGAGTRRCPAPRRGT